MTEPGIARRPRTQTYGLRLSLAYVAIFAIVTAVLVGFVYAYAVRALERESDEVIEAELQGLVEQYRAGGIDALHAVIDERARSRNSSGDVYLLVDPQLRPIAGNVAAWPGASTTANRRWVEFNVSVLVGSEFQTRKVRAGVFMLPGGDRLLVGTDIHEQQAFVARMGWTLLVSLLVVTAIGTLLGAWMNRHVLRRVDAISAAGRDIVEGNFSQRLPRSGSGDEFDTLAGNLNEMLERVERLTQALRFVIDATAHDLRGPLNRLRARIEAGLRSHDAATRELALSESLRDAEALEQTIAALLRIAQAQGGEAATEVGSIDLGALARDVVELYEPLALDRHVDLHVLAEPPAMLRGSRQLLAHALANLVDNALKFTPAGGRVDVRVVHRDGGLELSVADTGPGIAAGDRARALERGARLASAEGTPGSGLGLSLVEAVARMHHATLVLEDNAPGLRVVMRFGVG